MRAERNRVQVVPAATPETPDNDVLDSELSARLHNPPQSMEM
jgi:hypothetical protein